MDTDARALAAAQVSRDYAEAFIAEDAILADARARAAKVGCVPISAGGGAALRFLASLIKARAVVEIGTGTGVSGLWLLRGMAPDGVLTSVDIQPSHQHHAREVFAADGVAPGRARLISGRALEVLPRLTDAAYDLVLIDGAKEEYRDYLEQAMRLLRPGGVVCVDNALWHDRVADPARRDAETIAIRALLAQVREDEQLVPLLLPVGDGLLVLTVRD